MKKLLVAIGLLLLSVAPAMAGNLYGKGTLGIFSPTEGGLDETVSLYAALGMDLKNDVNAPISAELGIGYAAPDEAFVDVTIIPVTATFLYDLPVNTPEFAVNVGGGVGLYFWDVDGDYYIPGWGTIRYQDDGVELGFHLQGGAEYKLNSQISLVGEVKWSFADADYDADLGGLSLNAGAKINF